MVRLIRSLACLVLAIAIAAVGLVWIQVPHAGAGPGDQIVSTYDAGIGLIDLHLRDDYRGFERLVEVDPELSGLGADAARTVAVDDRFALEHRLHATVLLAKRERLDESFNQALTEAVIAGHQEAAFCHIDDSLDARLGCLGA